MSTYDFYLTEKMTNYKVLIIEEPESNLHPNLQSKLADILVLAYKTYDIHFILETHSEYLIRKLQYLIASDQFSLKTEDVAVYYFNNPDEISNDEKQIYKLREKDAENKFLVAKYYEKRKKYDSARIYYREIVNQYKDSSWAPKALRKIQDLEAKQ